MNLKADGINNSKRSQGTTLTLVVGKGRGCLVCLSSTRGKSDVGANAHGEAAQSTFQGTLRPGMVDQRVSKRLDSNSTG